MQYLQYLRPTHETLRDAPPKKFMLISFKIGMENEYHNNEYIIMNLAWIVCLFTNIVIKYCFNIFFIES